jgi:hypothetical protein
MPREQAISKGGPISYLDTACYFEVVVIIQHYSSWLRYSLGQSLRSLSLSRHDRHTSWIPADTLKSSNCLRAAVYKVITILTVVIWWHTRLGRTRLKRTKNRTRILILWYLNCLSRRTADRFSRTKPRMPVALFDYSLLSSSDIIWLHQMHMTGNGLALVSMPESRWESLRSTLEANMGNNKQTINGLCLCSDPDSTIGWL